MGGNPETWTDPSGYFSIGGFLSQVGQFVTGTWDQGVANVQAAGGQIQTTVSTVENGGSLTDVLGSLLRAGADLGGAGLDFAATAVAGFTLGELAVPLAIGAAVGTVAALAYGMLTAPTLGCGCLSNPTGAFPLTSSATSWYGTMVGSGITAGSGTTSSGTTSSGGTTTGTPSVPSAPSITTTGIGTAGSLGLTFVTTATLALGGAYVYTAKGKSSRDQKGGAGEKLAREIRNRRIPQHLWDKWREYLHDYKEGESRGGQDNLTREVLEQLADDFLNEFGGK